MLRKTIRIVALAALIPSGLITATHSASASESSPALAVHQSLTQSRNASGQIVYTLTKTVGVPSYKPAVARPASSSGGCQEDGGLRVQICNSVSYTAYVSGGFRYASISSVNNQATILDRSATLTELDYDIYATGSCGQGCSGVPHHEFAGNYTKPVSGQNYNRACSWYGQYQRLSENPFDIQGNKQVLKYYFRGTANTLRNDVALSNT